MYLLNIELVFPKNRSRVRIIAGAGMLALLFFTGCNKLKTKDPIIFDITAVMPHDGTSVAGVRYKIVEMKYKTKFGKVFGESSPTGWELHGLTDSYGKASGSFKGVFKTNYSYFIYFDYTAMQLPAGIDHYSVIGPEYDLLERGSPKSNSYNIRILPMCYVHSKIENVNCANENDSMRYKAYNYDEQPYQSFDYIDWSHYFIGCGVLSEYNNPNMVIGGHRVYQLEITRNGVTSIHVDTFNLLPNIVNELFLEY